MTCYKCEASPKSVKYPATLYLWPPLNHTFHKLKHYLQIEKFSVTEKEDSLAILLTQEKATQFWTNISDILSYKECEDVRALFLEANEELSITHLSKVGSLQSILNFNNASWLIEILNQDRLYSVFQPIYSVEKDLAPWAMEALLRGENEQGEEIGAGPIFKAAGEADLLFQLDLKARVKAIETFATLNSPLKLFVNFSPTSIYDPQFCLKSTIKKINELGIQPPNITFEITESQKHTNLPHLLKIMEFYRTSGFKVALDDVGAGYSGINILTVLRPDYVKLDIELIQGINTDFNKSIFVLKLIEACHALGAKIIAEGIETKEEAEWCLSNGVDYCQGFYFSRPQKLISGEIIHNIEIKRQG